MVLFSMITETLLILQSQQEVSRNDHFAISDHFTGISYTFLARNHRLSRSNRFIDKVALDHFRHTKNYPYKLTGETYKIILLRIV